MHLFKKIFIVNMCIFSLTNMTGCHALFAKPTDKIGSQLEKIKGIDYQLSLNKIDVTLAAKKMMPHMKNVEKLNRKIADNEPMKDFLVSFITKWNSEEKILASLTNGKQDFMSEVTAFFMRGYVKSKKESWKTPFPLFRP